VVAVTEIILALKDHNQEMRREHWLPSWHIAVPPSHSRPLARKNHSRWQLGGASGRLRTQQSKAT